MQCPKEKRRSTKTLHSNLVNAMNIAEMLTSLHSASINQSKITIINEIANILNFL
jgi:hypothetical protein